MEAILATAISIAFIHTLIGIDHYIPFIALSKTNNWTNKKTASVVIICGFGHVLSSIILGFIGIGFSIGVSSLIDIENTRGELATYFIIIFGLAYMIYGIVGVIKNKPHKHIFTDGHALVHTHTETDETHEHDKEEKASSKKIWGLFILFILGPCEPLIPLIMYPAAIQNRFALFAVTISFAICTIITMLTMTFIGLKGLRLVKIKKIEQYSHALAGFAVFACGIAIYLFPI